MMPRYVIWFLVAAVIVGGLLRFWGLGHDELIFDEGLYAFRSIGYLDYLESSDQPTPVQWFENEELSSWTKLSFHDHPPLFFLVQRFFFGLFGDSLFAARLPSALAGMAAIILFYLIARAAFRGPAGPFAGIAAAAATSVSFAFVSISRLSMLESLLLLLMLANIYFFLKFLENRRYWFWFGLTLGLAFLTKYVSAVLIPAYFLFLIITRSPSLRDKRFWAALGIAAILFLPVLIYNVNLYRAFGHFDLQFSYLLGQKTPWEGGEWGKTQEPFSSILANLSLLYSIPFIVAALFGIIIAVRRLRLATAGQSELRQFLWLTLLLLPAITILLMLTGSAIRFSVLYAIPAIFCITAAMVFLRERWSRAAIVVFGFFLAYELFFTVNTVFIDPPDYGIAKLDRYFDSIFGEARPINLPEHPNPHLDRVIQTYASDRPATLAPTGIIYDDDLSVTARLWLFSRRQYYHGIPIMSASRFQEILQSEGSTSFKGQQLYFVKAESGAPLRPVSTDYAEIIERFLQRFKQPPILTIQDGDGSPAFTVYKFSLAAK